MTNSLPDDALLELLSNTNYMDIIYLCQTSNRMYEFCMTDRAQLVIMKRKFYHLYGNRVNRYDMKTLQRLNKMNDYTSGRLYGRPVNDYQVLSIVNDIDYLIKDSLYEHIRDVAYLSVDHKPVLLIVDDNGRLVVYNLEIIKYKDDSYEAFEEINIESLDALPPVAKIVSNCLKCAIILTETGEAYIIGKKGIERRK